MAKRKTTITKRYRVLAERVSNDETGKSFKRGEIVTSSDFSAATLKHWAGQRAAIRRIFDGLEDLFDDKFEDFVRPVAWLFEAA